MEWFTSDSHFCHENIIKLQGRPFASVEEMNDRLIDNINKYVKKTDTLYHLGDFAFGSVEKGIRCRQRINCNNIYLIYGNHDEKNRSFREFRRAFGKGHCHDILEIRRDGRLIVMCHYPMLYCHHWDKGAWMLHGHMHGEGMIHPEMPVFDVGCDIWNYRPLSLTDVAKIINENIYRLPTAERYERLITKEKTLCQS